MATAEAALAALSNCTRLDSWDTLTSIAQNAIHALRGAAQSSPLSNGNEALDGWEGDVQEKNSDEKAGQLLMQLQQVALHFSCNSQRNLILWLMV